MRALVCPESEKLSPPESGVWRTRLSIKTEPPYLATSAGEAAFLIHRNHWTEVVPAGRKKFQYRFHRRSQALYADIAAFHRGDLISALDYAQAMRILQGLERTAERLRQESRSARRLVASIDVDAVPAVDEAAVMPQLPPPEPAASTLVAAAGAYDTTARGDGGQ